MTKSLGLVDFKGRGGRPGVENPIMLGLSGRLFSLLFPALLAGGAFLTAHIFFGY